MSTRMDLDLLGVVFTDYHLVAVGAAAFQLAHDWFIKQDLVIRDAPAGAGNLLVEGVDYTLATESLDETGAGFSIPRLSTRVTAAVGAGRNVYSQIAVINAAYQAGNLYFSGKYVGDSVEAEDYDSQQDSLDALLAASRPIRGLILSNNAGDANNDIDIAVGAAIDDSGAGALVLSAILTKRSDAAWAVGTGNGGMDAGVKPAAGWLYVWLIKRPDTGVVDALFSISATAPAMPASYTLKRRLGALRTSGSNILAFGQFGDEFRLKTLLLDRALAAVPNANRNTLTVTVPPGMTGIFVEGGVAASGFYIWFASTDFTDAAASATYHTVIHISSETGFHFNIPVDASSQIAYRAISTAVQFRLFTLGWVDLRGKVA